MSYGTVQAEKMTTESGYSLGAGNASSFKNRIINGAMVIDQRNAGAAVSSHLAFPVDRFMMVKDTPAGSFTAQQSTVAPAGFTNSLLYTVGTAFTPSSGQNNFFRQSIEGFNIADLGWGTANAKPVTLSFWVRSSLTGTFGGSLRNGASNRSFPFSYVISSADTFEYKTITIAGDTSGTWLTNNGTGIELAWGVSVGSNFSNTAGSWYSGNFISVTGAVNLTSTAGATLYITGVQLEVGTVATSFDFRSYGTELMLCQRYLPAINAYLTSNNTYSGLGFYKNNTTAVMLAYSFTVPARIPPTGLTVGSGASFTVINPATVNAFGVTSPAFNTAGFTWGIIDGTVSSGSANTPLYWLINGGANGLSAYFTGCEL